MSFNLSFGADVHYFVYRLCYYFSIKVTIKFLEGDLFVIERNKTMTKKNERKKEPYNFKANSTTVKGKSTDAL